MVNNDLCCTADQSDRGEPDSPPARPLPKRKSSGLLTIVAEDKPVRTDSSFSLRNVFERAPSHSSAPTVHHKPPPSITHGKREQKGLPRSKSFQVLMHRLCTLPSFSQLPRGEYPNTEESLSDTREQSLQRSLLDSLPYDSDAMAVDSLTRRIDEQKNELRTRASVRSIQWSSDSPNRVLRVDSGSALNTPDLTNGVDRRDGASISANAAHLGPHDRPGESSLPTQAASRGLGISVSRENSLSPSTKPSRRSHHEIPEISLESPEITEAGPSTPKPVSHSSPTLPPRSGSTHLRPTTYADNIELSNLSPPPPGSRPSSSHSRHATGKGKGKHAASSGRALSISPASSLMRKPSNASELFEDAVSRAKEERSALFLPRNKGQIFKEPLFRERSGSIFRHRVQSVAVDPLCKDAMPRSSLSSHQLRPAASTSGINKSTALCADENMEAARNYFFSADTSELGIWSRFPSHSRLDRTECAGPADHVVTRDFAEAPSPEMGIFRNGTGQSASSKRRSQHRFSLQKSKSWNFGKTFLRNWAGIFRTQSSEFRQHGHGHRSSVSTGGVLEYPELEVLAPVFSASPKPADAGHFLDGASRMEDMRACKSTGALRIPRGSNAEASLHGMRRRSRVDLRSSDMSLSSSPSLPDAGRWAAFYASCVDLKSRATSSL